MFDTHCHLNFKTFNLNSGDIIRAAKKAGVDQIVIPGTDLETSQKALKIAENNDGIYAAAGIHPHHVNGFRIYNLKFRIDEDLTRIETILQNEKVVAVGEVGIDRHYYKNTKYDGYKVDDEFIGLQKDLFKKQVKLAIKYNKSLIIHNREAKNDLFECLNQVWDKKLEGSTVLHCCEPDDDIFDYAISHKIYIGFDGDITYNKKKQEFIKKIPLDSLVLETDSPYLTPEPLKSQKAFPNEPKNLLITTEFVAKLLNISINRINKITSANAHKLFRLHLFLGSAEKKE